MLYFRVEAQGSNRVARVRYFNATTHRVGQLFDEVDITNSSLAATGSNNTIAYRPRYEDVDGGQTTAAFFINMREVFPCLGTFGYHPVCKIFTHEEDGFRGYRPIIEAADIGNNFRIFSSSSNIPTYGFAIQGCPEITANCFYGNQSHMIVCYLPKTVCSNN